MSSQIQGSISNAPGASKIQGIFTDLSGKPVIFSGTLSASFAPWKVTNASCSYTGKLEGAHSIVGGRIGPKNVTITLDDQTTLSGDLDEDVDPPAGASGAGMWLSA
jgi:hypothetical protein